MEEKIQKQPRKLNMSSPLVTQLKWTLIVNKIAFDNKIEVTAEDIKNAAKQQLLSHMQGQVIDRDQPWINDYANKMVQDKKFVEETMHRIETDKVFSMGRRTGKPH